MLFLFRSKDEPGANTGFSVAGSFRIWKKFPCSGECARSKRTRPILERISLQAGKIKTTINQIVTAEKAVSDLPISLRLKFTHWQTGLEIVKQNGFLYFALLRNLIRKALFPEWQNSATRREQGKNGNPVRRFFAEIEWKTEGSKQFWVPIWVPFDFSNHLKSSIHAAFKTRFDFRRRLKRSYTA